MSLQRRARRHPSAPDPCERLRALAPSPSPPPSGPAPPGPEGLPPLPEAPYAVAAPSGEPLSEDADRPGRSAATDRGGPGDSAPERPPSGYEEFTPDPPLLERISRRWSAHATLSRRSVLVLAVLGLLAAGAALMALREGPEPVAAQVVAQGSPVPSEAGTGAGDGSGAAPEEDLVVHVGGEVADPGLYTLEPGSRVADAVEAAGGALPEADTDTVNLARPLADGERILVGVPGVEAGTAGAGPPVDINLADAGTLQTLPRIGEVIAREIVAHREAHGPFPSVDALTGVSGIGERTLETLRPHITAG
ncbi:helix-hairpin-helix domain-containing protein [Nocardiopsis sp. LOL_012]|uniref:helix-hairpin-helix domain-containing protein n=1 Tax=Nocardiopsis sp. LOL_012 TaxID=3345409 RepID=UPI003A87B75E